MQTPKKKIGWKTVAIGQTAGILLGVGVLYVVKKMSGTETSDNDDHVATADETPVNLATVNDSLSFEHALAEAQASVGDDGVFTWRGGVYATCDEQQWNDKTEEQRQYIVDQVETEISLEQMEEDPNIDMQEDGFIHVTDGHGHDFVYVNNERIELSGGDDVSVAGMDFSEDDVGVISGFAATENAYVIYTSDDVSVVGDDDMGEMPDGEIVDMQTGEVYSQPIAIVQQDDDSQEVMVVDDDNELSMPEAISPELMHMEELQMDMQPMDLQNDDNSLMDDGFFDPGTDDFHAIDGGY